VKALLILAAAIAVSACSRAPASSNPQLRRVLLITIEAIRADHVGVYGYPRARTPTIDAIAKTGVVFERAYAAAPITLPSNATLLTGRYPPGHGARDNGIRVSANVRTLATELHARGFRTAAFVAAFPLDHQFGLDRGFDVYSDQLGRSPHGRRADERPASDVAAEATAWISANAAQPFFAWIHFFEPHAPYAGDPSRPVLERYDDEIAIVDRAISRVWKSVEASHDTLVVIAGDHGEAFGEHGEYAHSIFVYDTTLRVPLVIAGPVSAAGRRVTDAVTLADLAPTIMRLTGGTMPEADGIDLTPALNGTPLAARELYAESFAPLIEFGWAPLRSVRSGKWKFIAAPHPELFDVESDPDERSNVAASQASAAANLATRIDRYSPAMLPTLSFAAAGQAAERLRALDYVGAGRGADPSADGARPDPKDQRELAGRLAQVTSGELSGAELVSALEMILRADPRNGQAHLRLGFAYLQTGDCPRAEPELAAAISNGARSTDAFIGMATCRGRARDLGGAEQALTEARRLEPDNPIVIANIGTLEGAKGDFPAAIRSFESALAADPDLHEARFNLAIAYARSGRKADAAREARTLLARLPASAPQRPEVERLLRQVQ